MKPPDAMDAPPPPLAEARSGMRLGRYLSLYAALWKNSVVRAMGFKANFLLWILVESLWFAMQICFIAVIYQHTERIADWTKWEVVLLIGASQFIQQIFQAVFLGNLTQMSELIRTGKLDFMMLLPVNTRFLVSLRHADLGGLANAVSAMAVMGYALHQLGRMPTPGQWVGFGVLVVAGVMIHYALMFLLATVSFWTIQAQGIVWGYYSMFNLARLPDVVFRGVFKAVFTFVVPVLLIANVPVKLLVEKLSSPLEWAQVLVMVLVCLAVSEAVWRAALRRYGSASS